jgi:hypothetical protein
VDLQRRAIGYAAAVSEAGRTENTHVSRSTRGASSSASSAGGTPGPVLGENGANLGPPTMTGAAPLEAQRPTLMRPHATDTLGAVPDSPFDNTVSKGTRLIDLEAFLPQFYNRTSCRSCVEARGKQKPSALRSLLRRTFEKAWPVEAGRAQAAESGGCVAELRRRAKRSWVRVVHLRASPKARWRSVRRRLPHLPAQSALSLAFMVKNALKKNSDMNCVKI